MPLKKIKVFVLSHSGVISINRKVYLELAKYEDIDLLLFIPSFWKSDIRLKIESADNLEEGKEKIIFGKPYFDGNGSLYFYGSQLKKTLNRFKPEVVFIDEEPWSLSALQTAYHSSLFKPRLFFRTNQNIYKRYPFPFIYIQKYLFRSAAGGTVVSKGCKDILRRHGFNKEVSLIPYTVDTALFMGKEVDGLKSRLGLKGFVFGYMGRLTEEKGILTLLEAAYLLKNDFHLPSSESRVKGNFKLFIVGDGKLKGDIDRFIKDRGIADIVVMHPSIPHSNAADYLNCMDVFVLPSLTTPRWKEQFGRVVIEALSCGIAIIGSDSGAIPELIDDTGGGIIFPEGNAKALSGKMFQMMNDADMRRELSETGKMNVRKKYSIEAIAHKLHDILIQKST